MATSLLPALKTVHVTLPLNGGIAQPALKTFSISIRHWLPTNEFDSAIFSGAAAVWLCDAVAPRGAISATAAATVATLIDTASPTLRAFLDFTFFSPPFVLQLWSCCIERGAAHCSSTAPSPASEAPVANIAEGGG